MTLAADSRKRERFRLHHWLSSHSVRGGAATCMHALEGAGSVTVSRHSGGVVHVGGVQRCASVWSCPVCAPVIRERRAGEVDRAVTAALARGWRVAFVTATVSHKLGDSLADVYKLVTESWRATFGGRAAATLGELGYVGQVRVVEVTHGVNGWHPHIHALVFVRGNRKSGDALVQSIGTRFAAAVAARGGYCAVPGVGWTWAWCSSAGSSATLAGYLSKVDGGWGAGQELARGDVKLARVKGRSPFELLAAAVDGDQASERLWLQYEAATKGRVFMRWTPGLRDELGVGAEVSDEEAATAEPEAPAEATWSIPVALWRRVVRSGLLWFVLENARGAPPDVCIVTGERLDVPPRAA